MRTQRNLFQMKEQEKNPDKTTNETEINNLPDKEFKALIIRMLIELRKRTDENSENFNRELENMKKNEPELKNTIPEMKNTLGGNKQQTGDTEECISDLEVRIMEVTQSDQQKEKQIKRMRIG